jgi:hypothetical protein
VATLNAEAQNFRNQQDVANNTVPPGVTSPSVPPVSTGGTGTGSAGSSAGSAISPPATIPVVTSTPPSTLPDVTTTTVPSVVTLTSDSLEWYLSSLSSGQVAVIPVYSYSGTYSDGTSADLAWRIPALDPSAVTVPGNWTPFWFWPWGHVVPMMLQGVGHSTSGTTSSPPASSSPAKP